MSKIKAWKKESRTYLNAYDKGCDAVLYWCVEVHSHYNPKMKGKAIWAAELVLPRHGGSVYATRKAELRPLRAMQQEINKFNDAVEHAMALVEAHNNG